jgi:hypothetical protein
MRSTLQTWTWRWAQCQKRGAAVLDFREARFIEPWAVAMFTCFALELRRRGVTVELHLDPSSPSNSYLKLMGIEAIIAQGESSDRWDESTRTTGLHVLRTHADVSRFLGSAAALVQQASQDALDVLRYGMAELGRNVIQHADSAIGGVAIAQHFPERHAVQVAICDCGRGVFESLKNNYPEVQSNLESLKLALLPHSSGARPAGPYGGSENAGLGLFFCKEIAWRLGGSFWLASKDALLGVNDDDLTGGRGRVYRRIEPWEGTIVVMDFPDAFDAQIDELLGVCRELSRRARTDASAAALDFIELGSDLPDDALLIRIADFLEDVEAAARIRDTRVAPAVRDGRMVIMDFDAVRFATQSFIHSLLFDVFRIPGSLTRISFLRCTRATEEAVRLVAAYSSATYRQQPLA